LTDQIDDGCRLGTVDRLDHAKNSKGLEFANLPRTLLAYGQFASPYCVFLGSKLQDRSPEVVLGCRQGRQQPRPPPQRCPAAYHGPPPAGGESASNAQGTSGILPVWTPIERPLCAFLLRDRFRRELPQGDPNRVARPSVNEVRQGCSCRKGGLDRVSSHPQRKRKNSFA
jgi:hypothetical protein